RTGVLAVARRVAFQKVYDLAERVIPAAHRGPPPDGQAFRDWNCRSALERLVFATPGEIARFWDALSPAEATAWCHEALAAGELVEVAVEGADGGRRAAFAFAGLPERLAAEPEVCQPPARLRALSPFDPLIRDRQRLERVFGFDYRIEVFVPAPKRRYGYYVFPLLEGERLVGRADLKADRRADTLKVQGLWWEPKVRAARGRTAALEAELERLRRFACVGRVALP
ncbi:MAG: crosslink repair DNA glycosylase YcaQ family protein, partial [Tistlia sp.]